MDERGGRRMWSDEELDRALGAFRADVRLSAQSVREARLQVVLATAAPPEPAARVRPVLRAVRSDGAAGVSRRKRTAAIRLLGAAAVVGALAAAAVTLPGRDAAPPVGTGVSSVPRLDPAAQAIALLASSADRTARGGTGTHAFRYVETTSWDQTNRWFAPDDPPVTVLAEHVVRLWIPSDTAAEWQLDLVTTGNYKPVKGGDRALADLEAKHPTLAAELRRQLRPSTQTLRAQGGRFDDGQQSAPDPDAPHELTADEIVGLPRDPHELYGRLRAEAASGSDGRDPDPSAVLGRALGLLSTGIPPADLQAALYQALQLIPGLQVTDEAVDLDGRSGTALGVTDGTGRRIEAVIDPGTGAFLGQRMVDADGVNETFTAVTTSGVDELGAAPNG